MDGQDDAPIEVRDQRNANWFWIDNELLLHYARVIKPTAFTVYCTIAMHTGKAEKSWPSRKALADAVGVSIRTIAEAIRTLEKHDLIRVNRNIGFGNVYYLRPLSRANSAPVQPIARGSATSFTGPVQSDLKRNKLYRTNYKNKQENGAADAAGKNKTQTRLPLQDSSQSESPKQTPKDKVPPVVSKTTEQLQLIETLHETLKGPHAHPIKRPERYLRGLTKRLHDYTQQELVQAAKGLSAASWAVSYGKNNLAFLLQGNSNQASGDNVQRFLDDDADDTPNSKASFYDQVRARYVAKPA